MTASLTHMRAEIDESGDVVARQLAGDAGRIDRLGSKLRALDPPVLTTIARGSSDCCALYLKYLAEIVVGIPCASIGPSIATLYAAPLRLSRAVAVSISQSGRSPDIVEMQRSARKAGATTIAMVNEVDSPLATEAEELLPLMAGREQSVAATKSMIAGLVAGAALVAAWRGDADLRTAIAGLPALLPAESAPPPAAMIERVARAEHAFVLGRGATFAVATEAALKLKETCAIHAEAYSSAEVLHGPAELARPGFLVIAFMPTDAGREGMEMTLRLLAAAGADVVRVDAGGDDAGDRLACATAASPLLTPIAMIHRFYGLAEAVSRRLGRNPDHPRNLHKVTETI
jgi:glucosamine--fructose-6-phosphate aminotransferase (isomerizing)